MAWNEPSGHDKKSDPWNKKQGKTPPDLDEALARLKNKLLSLLNNKTGRNIPRNGEPVRNHMMVWLILSFVVMIWGIAGVFIVGPAEQAVVLRFGKYIKLLGPGPHWIPVFFENKIVQNVEKIATYPYTDKMLTKDENIVSVSVVVKYRINSLPEYLFNAVDPTETLQQATASAIRQVVGNSPFNEIIAEGREVWAQKVTELLTKILAQYNIGIVIAGVSPQSAQAPKEVRDAFDDAINAQEDEKRFKEQAYAYEAKVVPTAEGKAKRITEEAMAFAQQAVMKAKGEVAGFLELLPEYNKAPGLMRQRLYIETMQQVMANSNKIILDNKSSNIVNLPLEQLLAAVPKSKIVDQQIEKVSSNEPTEQEQLLTHHLSTRPESERSTYRGPRGQ